MGSEDSVTHWFEQIREGDSVAARAIWERYYPELVRLAREKLRGTPRRVADEDDIADSVMKSLLLAAQKGRFSSANSSRDSEYVPCDSSRALPPTSQPTSRAVPEFVHPTRGFFSKRRNAVRDEKGMLAILNAFEHAWAVLRESNGKNNHANPRREVRHACRKDTIHCI